MNHLELFNLSPTKVEPDQLDRFRKIMQGEESGFSTLIERSDKLIEETRKVYLKFQQKSVFVQVGIGGSSLGPEMLIKALGKNKKMKFVFINNIDGDELSAQLESLNLDQTLFYVVSKSGSTVETMAGLSLIFQKLSHHQIPQPDWKNYIVFSTDPVKSELLDLSHKLGISTLSIPSDVGGRFSVLTSVGFLPALFAGIDLDKLISGAKKSKESILTSQEFTNLASSLVNSYQQGFNQTVMMPYSSKMKEFSSWFVQLWAESLGKNKFGLTPIPSFGATDQHSQVQLFMEGPKNKVIFLIGFEHTQNNFTLKSPVNSPTLDLLSSFKLNDLMLAELHGTKKAFEEQNVPYAFFNYPSLNEESLGHMIFFFESLTAIVGCLFNINPFNQPGVEAGKKFALNWLKKKG